MIISRSREELKSLAKISGKCALVDIYLSNCNVERTHDASKCQNLIAEFSVEGALLKLENSNIIAKTSFIFKGLSAKSDKKHLIKIACDYILNYKLENIKDFDKNELEQFCDINSIYNAWPFFREMILNMASRMAIPPYVLPLLSIRQAKKEDDNPPTKEKHK